MIDLYRLSVPATSDEREYTLTDLQSASGDPNGVNIIRVVRVDDRWTH